MQAYEYVVPDAVREQAWHVLSFALDVDAAWEVTKELLLELAPKMEQGGLRETWIPYLEQGIEYSHKINDWETKARIQLHLGFLHHRIGSYEIARHSLQEARAQFKRLQDAHYQAVCYNRQAIIAQTQHHYELAWQLSKRALELLDENDPERGYSYFVMGSIAIDQHQKDKAFSLFKKALRIWKDLGNERYSALCQQNLARILGGRGQYDKSAAYFEQAIQDFQRLDDPVNCAITRLNFGVVWSLQGASQQALQQYEQAASIFRQCGDRHSLGHIYTNLGIEYIVLKNWDKAEEYFLLSCAIWRELAIALPLLNAIGGLGETYLGQHDFSKAISLFEEVLEELLKLRQTPERDRIEQDVRSYLTQALQQRDGHFVTEQIMD